MKQLCLVLFALFLIHDSFSQRGGPRPYYKDVDGVMMELIQDTRYLNYPMLNDSSIHFGDTLLFSGAIPRSIHFPDYSVTQSVELTSADSRQLKKRIHQRSSYGNSQAITPEYDLRFLKYHNGKVKWEIMISLWTNNFNASFPVRVQRQGDCLCGGRRGSCCTAGGISREMKIYLMDLLEKYNLPTDREEILNFGS